MALFSNDTKKKTKKTSNTPKAWGRGLLAKDDSRIANILKRPWFSEKALLGTEAGVYAFEVAKTATKTDVANAIIKVYGVTPRQVRMVNLPAKKVSLRTRRGTGSKAARHKAYVYLKEGDSISFA